MVRSQLAVVIPCHNEATTIGAVVSIAVQHGDVIVVDDRSSDDSRRIAETSGARVVASAAQGYDAALETGLRRAWTEGYAFVVTLDADGEHDPAHLAEFHEAFERGAGLVCGIRARPQRAAEHVVALIGAARFQIRDPLCGMKGYSRPLLDLYFKSGLPLSINMTPALLWRRTGGAHAQIRITGQARLDQPRFGRALKANWAIWRAFLSTLAKTRPAS